MVEGVTRHFLPSDCYVVAACGHGIDANFLQGSGYHGCIARENLRHHIAGCDKGEHEVLAVGKHASTAAATSHHVYAVGPAIFEIDLLVDLLVAPADHCGIHLPREKIITGRHIPRRPLLKSEKERKTAVHHIRLRRKSYMSHLKLI